MNINKKIMLGVSCAVVVTTVSAIVTVFLIAKKNRVLELKGVMDTMILQAEEVRSNMEFLHKNHAVDMPKLIAEAKEEHNVENLKEVYQQTALYKTVPVVAAWTSIEKVAKDKGFKFQTPSHPNIPARNPKNNTGADYSEAFDAFERGEKEFFVNDHENQELVLAKPVTLTKGCLNCHGAPSTSLTGDGLDPLGFPMESMRVGDIKGAFVLKAPMTKDAVVAASIQRITMVGSIVLAIILVGFYFFNRAFIVRPLGLAVGKIQLAGGETNTASVQLKDTSQSLSTGATQQAAALEETSASLEEISGMSASNAQNAQDAKGIAEETRSSTERGATDMKEMARAMDDIRSSGDEISKIIKTIDEIAFQTTILALNAAVEAARAGEAGMGFAVVADEVKSLAQRSAEAAKETAARIASSVEKSEHGVQVCGKVSDSLSEIFEKAVKLDQLVADINSASKEQKTGIDQINTAVTEMDQLTQSNAASSEESAAAAEHLSGQAETLMATVGELQKIIGVQSTGALQPASHSSTSKPTKRFSGISFAKSQSPSGAGTNGSANGSHEPEYDLTSKDADDFFGEGSSSSVEHIAGLRK